MADWGAFVQALGESGSRAYHGAQDYRYKVAQVAYENALREREMKLREGESALAQEAQRKANEEADLKLRRAQDLEATTNELVSSMPPAQGPDITQQVKSGRSFSGKNYPQAIQQATKTKRAALKLQSLLAPGLLTQGVLPPTEDERLNRLLTMSKITRNQAAAIADINVKTASPNRQIEYMIYMGQLRAKQEAGNIEPWEEQTLKAMETKLNKEDAMDLFLRWMFSGMMGNGEKPSPMPGGGGNDDIDPSTGRPWGE